MALKLKVLKVPVSRQNNDDDDPGEGTSRGPVPQAEARTRHHVYNQTVVQGW